MNKYEKLEKLQNLLRNGAITESEYESEKQKLLSEPDAPPSRLVAVVPAANLPWGMPINTFCMLMHLALLLPSVGFILTIIMWATNKDRFVEVDRQGKALLNWIISLAIYGFGIFILYALFVSAFILSLAMLMWFLLVALVIAGIVFIIMGAVKSNEGKLYIYPLAITFIAIPPSPKNEKEA